MTAPAPGACARRGAAGSRVRRRRRPGNSGHRAALRDAEDWSYVIYPKIPAAFLAREEHNAGGKRCLKTLSENILAAFDK